MSGLFMKIGLYLIKSLTRIQMGLLDFQLIIFSPNTSLELLFIEKKASSNLILLFLR